MDLLSVIRRWHHREKLAIREIARRTELSRNTIRKYLASDEVEPRYPRRSNPSKLDAYAKTLSSWLKRESRRPRKRRRNLKQLYHDLVTQSSASCETLPVASLIAGNCTFCRHLFLPTNDGTMQIELGMRG